jgi:hypothetical protein
LATKTLIGSPQSQRDFGADCTGNSGRLIEKPSGSLSSNALPVHAQNFEEIFKPPPYHPEDDHNSFRPRFPTLARCSPQGLTGA